jgi:acyl-coenzyme A synthetase/AMP-(fatty) acid ligase
MENVSDTIFHYASETPDAPAVVEGGTTLGYAAFASLVTRAAGYLEKLGVVQGDRVAVAMTNSIDHLAVVFALYRIGAVLVEVPSVSPPFYRAELVRKFGVRFILVEAGTDMPSTDAVTVRLELNWRQSLGAADGDPRVDGGAAPCAIVLSSGSTGTPKGMQLSHEATLRQLRREATMVVSGIVSPDRPGPVLIPVSISYGGFFGATMVSLANGSCVVLLPKFFVAADMIRVIASWRGAVLPATPDMCRTLIASKPREGLLLPALRALVSMGQPLYAGEKRTLVEHVTPNLYDIYGAVGVGSIAYLRPEEMLTKGSTVGRVIDGVDAEIVDAAGRPVPRGRVGHVRARRPGLVQVFEGEGEAEEWVYPGEIGHIDAEGYLHLRGRTADMVTRHGVDIFPPEIEAALVDHPAIQDAAVVDRPVPGFPTELVAFIVKSGAVEHDDLVEHCRTALPADKWPDRIFYIDALPRLGTGKLDRAGLRSLAQGSTIQGSKAG